MEERARGCNIRANRKCPRCADPPSEPSLSSRSLSLFSSGPRTELRKGGQADVRRIGVDRSEERQGHALGHLHLCGHRVRTDERRAVRTARTGRQVYLVGDYRRNRSARNSRGRDVELSSWKTPSTGPATWNANGQLARVIWPAAETKLSRCPAGVVGVESGEADR